MHPLHRLLIGISLSLLVYLCIRERQLNSRVTIVLLWDVFALAMILTSWIVIFSRETNMIRKQARKQDGSVIFVFALILVSSFASLLIVMLLIVSKNIGNTSVWLYLPVAIAGMVLSWILVHTIFIFHYAHIYYDNDRDPNEDDAGLDFPEEKQPDYLDFAYFAFVIGMTFQVSDVSITSHKFRKLALFHGLLSFGLNTFVIALTINIIAGLRH